MENPKGDAAGDAVVVPPDVAPDGMSCVAPATTDAPAWPMPNDDVTLPHPRSYTADPFVVTDNVTGLVWQRVISPQTYTRDAAATYCANLVLGGACDWRLPQRVELVSIADYIRHDPAIDPVAFPGTPVAQFWSATGMPATNAWYVDFAGGGENYAVATNPNRVRCVRGGHAPIAPRFQITAEMVLDTGTQLTWQQSLDPGSYSVAAGKAYCASLALNGTGWRLPSIGEFESLVDTLQTNPAIDPVAFPATPNAAFWSATLLAADNSQGWPISFDFGYTFRSSGTALRVRCVR